MDILRITARWSGFAGAPGYSSFHFTTDGGFWDGGLIGDSAQVAADGAADRVSEALSNLRLYLPASATISIESEAVVLDSDSGEQIGFVEVDAPGVSGNPVQDSYSAVSGAVANWRTNDYRFGRRIRGRTFIVPLSGNSYEEDGTLSGASRSAVSSFADEMVNGGGSAAFGVWSRPRNGAGGVFASVVGSNVPDMAAVLRSRRD